MLFTTSIMLLIFVVPFEQDMHSCLRRYIYFGIHGSMLCFVDTFVHV